MNTMTQALKDAGARLPTVKYRSVYFLDGSTNIYRKGDKA